MLRPLLDVLRKSNSTNNHRRFGLLRNDVAVELLERTKRAEADTREAQVSLEVEVEGKMADQARTAGLEKQVSISSSSTRFFLHRRLGPVTAADHFFHRSKSK